MKSLKEYYTTLLDRELKTETTCRLCGFRDLEFILGFGDTPLADRLVDPTQPPGTEAVVPLDLVFCPRCSLVQISETVAPHVLFDEKYPYFSSVSPELLRHSRENALELIEARGLNEDSLV